MNERVTRSRELIARGFTAASVTRVLQISRQAVYRVPTPRTAPQRRPVTDPVEQAIVEVAEANQTDGYRMVCAMTRQRLGTAVNRKRVLRVMRERKLIQRRRPLARRKRPGFFIVERPRQLWQLDMTSIWVAEHGWTYLNAIIDCCTREICLQPGGESERDGVRVRARPDGSRVGRGHWHHHPGADGPMP